MTTAIAHRLQHYIHTKTPISVGIRGTGQPVGPGVVELIGQTIEDGAITRVLEPIYRIICSVPEPIPNAPAGQMRFVKLPVEFDAADVVAIILEPIRETSTSKVDIGPDGRTKSGIIIQ